MKKSNQEPSKLDGNQILTLIEGCRGKLKDGIGVALMASLSRISPELHTEIAGSVNDPSSNKQDDICKFFKAVASEAGYNSVPKNFKK